MPRRASLSAYSPGPQPRVENARPCLKPDCIEDPLHAPINVLRLPAGGLGVRIEMRRKKLPRNVRIRPYWLAGALERSGSGRPLHDFPDADHPAMVWGSRRRVNGG